MSEAVGTVHLNISADLNTLESRLKSGFARMAPTLGREFSDRFSDEFSRRLAPSMTSAVRGAFNKAQRSLTNIHVKVVADLDKGATQAQLDKLASQNLTVDVDVEADTTKARTEIDRVAAKAPRVNVTVDADTDRARNSIGQLSRDVNNSVGGFAALGSAALLGVGTIVPVAGAAAGAMVALGGTVFSVGAAFGVAAIAFSGIKDAVSAMSDQQAKAGQSAAQAQLKALSLAGAYDQVKQAQMGVADAQRDAGLATRDAAQRTADAERDLKQAQLSSLDAQRSLNDARKDAARTLEDLSARVTDAALSEREAKLNLTEAEQNYRKTIADPKATQLAIQQAELRRDRARQNFVEATREAQRSKADADAATKAGVEGSTQVVAAKKGIQAANQRVGDAERKVAEARANEAETARQNSRNVAAAQQGVIAAQRSLQAALISSSQSGAAGMDKVKQAMDNLSPAGRTFARFLFGLAPEFDKIKAAAQSSLLPPLQKAIEILLPFLPKIRAFVASVGAASGEVAIKIAKMLTGPEFGRFFKTLATDAPVIIRSFGDLLIGVGKIMANIFTAAAPSGKTFLAMITGFFAKVAEWTGSKTGQDALKGFFDKAIPVMEQVWEVIKSIGRLLGSIFTGSGGGQSAVDNLKGLAEGINSMATFIDAHPSLIPSIQQIAIGLLAMKALGPIIAIMSGVNAVFSLFGGILTKVPWDKVLLGIRAAMTALLGPVGLVIAIIAALAAGLIYAYRNSETFRKVVDGAIRWVGDVVKKTWEGYIKPALSAMGTFFGWLWDKAIKPALTAIGAMFRWLYDKVIQPVWQLIKVAIDIAWAAIQVTFGLMQIGIKVWSAIWNWLYDKVIKPVFGFIATHISETWTKKIKPVLDTVWKFVQDTLAPKFKTAIGVIAGIWSSLQESFKAPIRFLIQTVLNDGLLKAYNFIADKFNVDPRNVSIAVPSMLQAGGGGGGRGGGRPPTALATGGSVRGPGTETSDSIPALLSRGEHVWTAREVRASGGHQAMEAMRASALRQDGAPRFAIGGAVWDWVTDKSRAVAGKIGDFIGTVQDYVTDPAGAFKKLASQALGGLPGGKDGMLNKLIGGAVGKGADGLANFVKSALGGGGGLDDSGGGYKGPVGSGVERWRSTALQALAMTGQGPAHINSLLRRMNQESGGNPRAINLWDSNYLKGIPSKGLMQVIDPTFRAHHMPGTSWDIYDPIANITSSIRYALSRYGSLPRAYDRKGGYDEGGWLQPGTTMVHNNTGKPEAVFNPQQWAALQSNLAWRGNTEAPSRTTNIDVMSVGDPDAVATAILAAQGRSDLLDAISF